MFFVLLLFSNFYILSQNQVLVNNFFIFLFLLPFSNFHILPEAKRFVNSFLRLFFAVL